MRGQAEQVAGVQRPLQGAALLGEVAGPVGGDPSASSEPTRSRRAWAPQRDQLGAAPGADEGHGADPVDDQVGEQVGGLGGGRPADRCAVLAA